ncbi:hypothetical protein HPP92_009242 [Vanilla planifolia]|uniref:Uncharacterized protein n=1 Tax=Vanilla planifolia TaxID=51239 RepID=A0A835V6G2_VANPL|nr:hypothetical protein HPP92_009242 [Vanilla planifolia]
MVELSKVGSWRYMVKKLLGKQHLLSIIAYIIFVDGKAFSKALKLNGYDFGDYTITVEEARPKADINKGGGRDGGWSGGGGGVRDGGWSGSRGGGRDGGKRRRGSRDTSQVKKTTFVDD